MTTIGFVRHGITDWNIQRIAQGSSDIPLNETGREQARAIASRLAQEEPWDVIISSDLIRARETAETIAAELGMPIDEIDPRIRELSGGLIEGTTEADRVERWGTDWREKDLGREPLSAGVKRSTEAIQEAMEKYPGKRILMVSHGGLIGLALKNLLPDRFEKILLNNTSITILENVESKWECTLYNCTKHLPEVVEEQIAGNTK
ncbi:histidine phosphatase family protein [Planomicrobium chinense]|uniref:histidine phosphatase family protein n=1 Tax=Planococcus chinensis TaxID=272917 RepID=UPI001CC50765|nr:histidine phosphatase family protein [Planococcus chinensis]MBZ5201078.1 histidine phosphatase family protein [Planococcus chinensis]